ncbi:MAG: AlpA family phage regulatory protein [Pseudomonadota bacterium]|mgnify:FL=1
MTTNPDRFLSQKEVMAHTSLSRMTIYRMRQTGDFPSPVYLNKQRTRVAWRESELLQWMQSRVAANY